ncbi:transcriptional regulator, AraC family protein [Oceanospirillum sp. MED92]|uniref:Transcriptional regulator, AraC family protein n=1 Tax=Neptuniibacter caesariensis TaxID=207954 RepID=A0A7U8GRB9_NEPCE|nr:helix-turn-helix domain-containing protein [Neptuniibacter caesariensis]EAR60176.1 transcriptional regulator, AraC family protein [Oceanospirillum sp. MED92] [Neptuniibacter caesariensis]
MVQGIWTAQVPDEKGRTVVKPLYSDAGSGIIFNLGCNISIGDENLPSGVFLLPVKKVAQSISLPASAKIAGIRFHPAAGYGVLGDKPSKPILLERDDTFASGLYHLFDELKHQTQSEQQIKLIFDWCIANLATESLIPTPLEKAFSAILCGAAPGQLSEETKLSQRQIERLFNTWLGMTPKHYQRIQRVRQVIQTVRERGDIDLAELAVEFGFSDQAHMTREFKSIAATTPGKFMSSE